MNKLKDVIYKVEVRIEREKYYKNNYEGFAIFLVTRAYNDLQINTSLFESLKDEGNEEAQIYLFKLLTAHLKETLKILGIIKRSDRFKGIMNKWRQNLLVDKIFDEISEELEKPSMHPNTVNAKYLDFRNDVFHYCSDTKDFEEYKVIQNDLKQKNINVLIQSSKENKYLHELGVDIQISQGIFNQDTIKEVNNLKIKVQTILKEILNDYFLENKAIY